MKHQSAHRLQAYCADKFQSKRDVRILNLENITSGWESEIYGFSLMHGQVAQRVREDLVLRLYFGAGAEEKSAREFRSIQRLHAIRFHARNHRRPITTFIRTMYLSEMTVLPS